MDGHPLSLESEFTTVSSSITPPSRGQYLFFDLSFQRIASLNDRYLLNGEWAKGLNSRK